MEYLIEIKGFPDYFITESGDVYSEKKKGGIKKLNPGINKNYKRVVFTKDRKIIFKRIHQILAETFIPNPENKKFVDHIDRNKQNNNITNLRWVTFSENQRNSNKYKNNTSGISGVHFDKRNQKWIAQWCDNSGGNQKNKSFTLKDYPENAKQLAIDYRKKMEEKYYPTLTK